MRRHLRRATSILAFAAIACGLLGAEQVKQLKPNGFVNDFANVIDAESNRQIQYLCTQVDQRAQAQIAVVTVQSLEGSTIEMFARHLFRQWGIGPKSNNRGVLILLAIRDHKFRIEVGTGLESVVTDRKAAGFGREAVPFLKEFKYGRALQIITRRVTDAIAADAQISIGDAPAPTPAPAASYQYSSTSTSDIDGVIGGLVIALVVIGLVVWLLVAVARGSYSGPSYGYSSPVVYNNVGGYYNHSNTVFLTVLAAAIPPVVPAVGAAAAVLAVEEIPAVSAVAAQTAAVPAAVGAALPVTAQALVIARVAAKAPAAVQAAILAVAAQMVAAPAEAGNTQENLCSRKSSSSAKNIWRNWWRNSSPPQATTWSA